MPGVTLDIGAIEQKIVQAAMRGGQDSAEYALGRIRQRAPVRKIFRGTAYRQRGGFREPRPRQVVAGGERRTGHANDLQPLFRMRTPRGTAFISGDFRRVDPNTGKLAAVKPDLAVEVRGGKVKELKISEISAQNIRVTGGKALTGRGRFEVKTGRANFRDPETGTTRVGGRLRGELHIEGPVRNGGQIWWYIVSRTKERGRLYGRDQEFGNRHNRPHPFMRPGLQESRTVFKNRVKRSVQEATRRR